MFMRKKIIVDINLNTWAGKKERLEREWLDYRISIFMDYTLKSLKAQSEQDFLALVRYDPASGEILNNILLNHKPLPENILFVTNTQFHEKIVESIRDYDYLYHTFLASDDMFHIEYFKYLKNYNPCSGTLILIPQYGYVYNSISNILGRFFFYAPSFCTIVYKTSEYLKGKRYVLEGGWTGALKLPYEIIKMPAWINHIHGCNSALSMANINQWTAKAGNPDPWTMGEGIKALFGYAVNDKDEIKKILKEFTGE